MPVFTSGGALTLVKTDWLVLSTYALLMASKLAPPLTLVIDGNMMVVLYLRRVLSGRMWSLVVWCGRGVESLPYFSKVLCGVVSYCDRRCVNYIIGSG